MVWLIKYSMDERAKLCAQIAVYAPTDLIRTIQWNVMSRDYVYANCTVFISACMVLHISLMKPYFIKTIHAALVLRRLLKT